MGKRHELQVERAELQFASEGDFMQRHVVEQPVLRQLAAQHGGGERRRIDRAFQPLPQMGDGADMVLVGVGEDEAEQVLLLAFDIERVGHDDFNARLAAIGEGDAQVDRQPFTVRGRTIAVEVEVHADLARAAERQEDEFVVDGGRAFALSHRRSGGGSPAGPRR